MSTFICIFFLDVSLFNSNKSCGIICDTLGNAKKFLKKIKFAYDHLPKWLRDSRTITRYSFAADDAGITFSNGSSIEVGTSFRSGTLQYLHISEHAKICKKTPEKANEIRAGALNTVQAGQMIFIESTAEGGDGDFYNFTKKAENMQIEGKELSKLDFRFHFFTWWKHPEYSLKKPKDFFFSVESERYFAELESKGIKLTEGQKFWYIKKKVLQADDMFKEYPSTAEEAFQASDEAKWFKTQMLKARKDGRVCEFEVDLELPVHTHWDLGMDDYTSVWLYQLYGKEIRLIDYVEGSGEGLKFYKQILDDRARDFGYKYGKHYAPHDIAVRELGTGKSRMEAADEIGLYFERRRDGDKLSSAVPALSFEDGIDASRRTLGNCWFKESTTQQGVEHLEKYSKKWSEPLGQYTGELHNEHAHGAAAFRYLSVTIQQEVGQSALEFMRDRNVERDAQQRAKQRVHKVNVPKWKVSI